MADKKNGELLPEDRLEDIAVAPGGDDADGKDGDDGTPAADDGERPDDAAHDEKALEKGVEDSMDASDPPAAIQP